MRSLDPSNTNDDDEYEQDEDDEEMKRPSRMGYARTIERVELISAFDSNIHIGE